MKQRWLIICLLVALSGCNFFTPPDNAVQLVQTENETYTTQIAAVQATATYASDRLMLTMEFAQTAVRNVDAQSTRIASTLIVRGTMVVDSSNITPIAPTQRAATEGQVAPTPTGVSGQVVAPIVVGEGSARGSIDLPEPTPVLTALPQITPNVNNSNDTGSSPSLSNVTLSGAVGGDDCPVSPSSQFSAQDESIYVTAVGNNLTPNNLITSRWMFNGTQVATYDWSPPGNVNGACIWFYITQEGVEFTPGNWGVELTIDGNAAGGASFTIVGETMTEGS
jgi:hypothetical protein